MLCYDYTGVIIKIGYRFNLIHLHLYSQISDCGMVLEEQPGKVSEAFRLFLQGEGYGK